MNTSFPFFKPSKGQKPNIQNTHTQLQKKKYKLFFTATVHLIQVDFIPDLHIRDLGFHIFFENMFNEQRVI